MIRNNNIEIYRKVRNNEIFFRVRFRHNKRVVQVFGTNNKRFVENRSPFDRTNFEKHPSASRAQRIKTIFRYLSCSVLFGNVKRVYNRCTSDFRLISSPQTQSRIPLFKTKKNVELCRTFFLRFQHAFERQCIYSINYFFQ